tara:strand:- start:582 stop:3776 length:3195 start_codon:yes stop_codon:yes gene_type:complete
MNNKAFLTSLPDFVEVQRASYCWFLAQGLRNELENFSHITNYSGLVEIFIFGSHYKIRRPKYGILESKKRELTFGVRLYIPMALAVFKEFRSGSNANYIMVGELPLMTDRGTFVINGCERVVVNQIIRSPGVYFKKETVNKKIKHIATLVPSRGSWLKFEIDETNAMEVSVNKNNKFLLSDFIYDIGLKKNDIRCLTYPEFFIEFSQKITKKTETMSSFDMNVFNQKYFYFGDIGRYKINKRLNLNIPKHVKGVTQHDIISIVDFLIVTKLKYVIFDDIDHLKSRRVRSVGELLQTQFRNGLLRLERILTERMTICDPNMLRLPTLVTPRPIIALMREFFGTSQLSQFLDQTNPLSELTHKRRISSLGPGGLNRERVSFIARDIHPSHYGRICPIETPEGQNAGLISSLATYARVNSFGFLETPFFQVKRGFVLKSLPIVYLMAEEENSRRIAPSDLCLTDNNKIREEFVTVRYEEGFMLVPSIEVELIAVSTVQIISAATALIPFLEHDDANRALMGSNMQRQAVPLLFPSKPIVGTGFEVQLATDAGMVIINYFEGKVKKVSSEVIIIETTYGKKTFYFLQKYVRSNQDTCINQRPIVWEGEYVNSGQIIADGPSSEDGELALGQNVLIAYMPWGGFNYEDALLINERLVYSDLFTSIHIEKHQIEVVETSLGVEKITRDIPLDKENLSRLDENGIIKEGMFVLPGDVLVGKLTPFKNPYETPEGRLLKAIFGIKTDDVINNSLKVPKASYGRVLDIRVLNRQNGDELPISTHSIINIYLAQIKKIQVGDKMAGRHGNKGIISRIIPQVDMPYLPDGSIVDIILNPLGVPSRMNVGQLFEGLLGFAGQYLDKRFKVLPFDEIFQEEASRILTQKMLQKLVHKNNNLSFLNSATPGRINLVDGQTGELFDNPITVCKSYMLKLVHMVDDKIHARSTGPYSLVTQQPLGGRSQQGGQRFGEMEVWALEAFGAAYTLQELLTIKSDDMEGRNDLLHAIIKGKSLPTPSIPESFKVLILELQSLGLDIGFYKIKNINTGQIKTFQINLINNSKNYSLLPCYESIEF